MKYIIILLIGEAIGWFVCEQIEFPYLIEKRAKELNLMKYDGKTDSFKAKGDTVVFDFYLLHYLKYGKYKNLVNKNDGNDK
jgi:hypothetical protein